MPEGTGIEQMMTKSRPAKVAFVGHFGAQNFGNEGTLEAMLYNLRRRSPETDITCICTVPKNVAADYKVTAINISDTLVRPWRVRNPIAKLVRRLFVGVPSECYRWLSAIMVLSRTDALIVPGTGLLTDAYSLLGWGPYNIFKWAVISKICRCRLLFVSVGAGPLYGRLGRYFVRTALSLADFRSYRDMSTMHYLESIGLQPQATHDYPDLVFSLPVSRLPTRSSEPRIRQVVGVGLMEYAGRYSVEQPNKATYSAYLDSMAALVGWLLENEYDVRLLIGDFVDASVVRDLTDILRTRLENYDAERISNQVISSVGQLLSQIGSTDIVVATRFHNILMALLLDKPVISISFHHKCVSLMAQMGLSEYCLDINGLRSSDLIETFCRLRDNAQRLTPGVREKVQRHREALDKQYGAIFELILPT
jgi:polysaccharide pyruvyl transferase WcaK-like protein